MTVASVQLTLEIPVNIQRFPDESYADFHKRVVTAVKEQIRDLPVVGEVQVMATIKEG